MSSFGGVWGPELKYAGYDNIVITGKADKPAYLAINNDDVQIKDASHLWGMDTYDTPVAIRKELGSPNAQIACIGPAGENLVAYATIESRVGNGAGRTGMGAVMGSKNLKAIAVRGTKGVSIAEPEKFLEVCLEAFRTQKTTPAYKDMSTEATMPTTGNDKGNWLMVLGNYESSKWDEYQNAHPEGHEPFWREHINRSGDGRMGCFNCQVRCMEYYNEPQPGLGPLIASCNLYTILWQLKLTDFVSWYKLASRCQRYGIDVVSLARMITWAMGI
jgi:aldehyde:ferredoxin oxidoreductase